LKRTKAKYEADRLRKEFDDFKAQQEAQAFMRQWQFDTGLRR
jgi:hypothetical protein